MKSNGYNIKDLSLLIPTSSAITTKISAEMLSYALNYKNILDSVKAGIFYIDRNDRILFMNLHLCSLLDYKVQEISGQSAFHLLLDEETQSTGRMIDTAVKSETSMKMDWRKKNGEKFNIELLIYPVWTEEENTSGYLGLQKNTGLF